MPTALYIKLFEIIGAPRNPGTQEPRNNAPWHRGKLIDQVLAEQPHLPLYRLPSDSPQLNVIERLWKVLRRQATHNRLFASMATLKPRYAAAFVTTKKCANPIRYAAVSSHIFEPY